MHITPTHTLLARLRSLALKRWVLACFVLATGVATASGLIKPQALELLCSTNGAARLIVQGSSADDAPAQQQSEHNSPCALCLPLLAPPPEQTPHAPHRADLSYALRPWASAPIRTQARPALPARGPPLLF